MSLTSKGNLIKVGDVNARITASKVVPFSSNLVKTILIILTVPCGPGLSHHWDTNPVSFIYSFLNRTIIF